MVHDVSFSVLFLYAVFLSAQANYDPFSDLVQFSVHFPGPPQEAEDDLQSDDVSNENSQNDENGVFITTANNEKYRCIIPDILVGEKGQAESIRTYKGPNENVLLKPLFDQSSCSYKIEPYWTYELCHGKYLRQYHEEKDAGKGIKLQEYYLGYHKKSDDEEKKSVPQTEDENQEKTEDVALKFVTVGGQNFPYYDMRFEDGTHCDLNGRPRRTSVRYICHELGRGEVYELKETSSCEYAVVILTQNLCSHPKYRPQSEPINQINCHSLDGSPQHPQSLVDFEVENTDGRYNKKELWQPEDGTVKIVIGPDGIVEADLDMEDIDWEEETGLSLEAIMEFLEKNNIDLGVQESLKTGIKDKLPSKEKAPASTPAKEKTPTSTRQKTGQLKLASKSERQTFIRDFLSGEYCIQGGTGWWKHEYCHGKTALQYHEDRTGKTIITLGKWNEEKHLEWLDANPIKKPSKKVLSLFYGDGDICDLTGKPRFVEVKLKCKESTSEPNAISIYIVEHKPCEYSMVIEAQLMCMIISQADEDGFIEDFEIP